MRARITNRALYIAPLTSFRTGLLLLSARTKSACVGICFESVCECTRWWKSFHRQLSPFLRAPVDKDEIWDEVIYAVPDDETPDETPERAGLRPSMRFFCAMTVLGVALALGWRFSGAAEMAPQLWAFVLNSAAGTPSAKTADDPLVPLIADLAALKKQISGLIAANQEMTATIKALQAEQGLLQQRVAASHAATHLFSEPKLLQMNIVAAGRPSHDRVRGPPGRARTGRDAQSRDVQGQERPPCVAAPVAVETSERSTEGSALKPVKIGQGPICSAGATSPRKRTSLPSPAMFSA